MLFAATPLHLTVSTACPRPTFGPLSPPLASPSLPRQPRSPVELSCFWCDGHIILFEAFSAPAPSTAEFFRSLSPNIYPHLVPPPHHLLRYRWVTGPAGPSPSLARPRSSVCLRLNNPLGTRGPLSLASLLGAVGSSCPPLRTLNRCEVKHARRSTPPPLCSHLSFRIFRIFPICDTPFGPTGLLMSPTNRCVPPVARAGPAPAPLARIRHLHFPFRPYGASPSGSTPRDVFLRSRMIAPCHASLRSSRLLR